MREPDHSTAPQPEPGALPRPWLAAALLAAVAAVCASLGFWQLGRAGESRAAVERFHAALELPAARLRTADDADAGLRYRRVSATGRYVPERQILIDNIVQGGVAGYYVLTPFEPTDGARWLIVNRGWVPAGPSRERLPDVSVDGNPRQIAGLLDRLPSPGLRLGEPPAPDGEAAVQVMSFPTIAMLERMLGRRLYDYQLRLDPDQPDGFAREVSAPGLGPERHLGYAVQWWLFGTIAGAAAVVIAVRTLRRRSE